MTNFINDFFWHSVLAALVASVWFILPGIAVLRLLKLITEVRSLSAWLVAPALGLCTYGPFSLAFTALFGYTMTTLIISWLIFLGGITWWSRRQNPLPAADNFCSISSFNSLLLLVGAALWSSMATMPIFPAMYQDGLFVNTPIFDHAKVALVDAIAREGLLPINPYYAPEGQTIPLIYYYTWHFLASQLKLLTEVSGWPVEVAFNWFTGLATLSFLSALAIRLTQRTVAGIFVILLAFAGHPLDILPLLFGPRLDQWVNIPPGHGLELLWLQMMWVPQHILSALAVIVSLFLTSRLWLSTRLQFNYTVIIGLTIAAGFGASTWVGGIGLVLISPLLLMAGLWLRLPWQNYFTVIKSLLLIVGVALIFALPLLISQASGPPVTQSEVPFGLGLLPATRLFTKDGLWGKLGHLILFWVQFLPLNLGIVYVLGILALLARNFSSVADDLEMKSFQLFSGSAILGYLLICQLMKSTFWNNSFGWRAVLVPVLLLMVWSAVALTELATARFSAVSRWRPGALLVRWRAAILPLTMVGLTVGILSTINVWHLPDPSYAPPPPDQLALHQGFLRQAHAWEKVREYAGSTDRVQANPDGYATLTPWPASLPYALFADRPTAYANVEYATVFAYRYDQANNREQYQLVQTIFSAHPTEAALKKVRDLLKVKVILIDRFDAAWSSEVIDRSEIYRLAYGEVDFKIYVAH